MSRLARLAPAPLVWIPMMVIAAALFLGAAASPSVAPAAPAAGPILLPDADGYLRAWLVAGPYAYDKLPSTHPPELPTPGFERDFLIEATGTAEPATRAALTLAAGSPWRPFVSDGPTVELLDAVRAPAPHAPKKKPPAPATASAVVYAYAEIDSPAARDAWLRLGSDDGARVWLDGVEVAALRDPASHAHHPDRLSAPVHLRAGATALLVKIDQRKGAWRFSLRLCDADDRPLPGATVRLPGSGAGAGAALAEAVLRAARVRFSPSATRTGFEVGVAVDLPPARAAGGDPFVRATAAHPGATGPIPLRARPASPATLHLGAAHTLKVRLSAPGAPPREETFSRPAETKLHALVADAADLLVRLRAERPDLLAPRRPPPVGVWAELAAGAPGSGDPHGALDATGVATLEWLAGELRGLLESGDRDAAFVARRAAELRRVLAAVRAGKDPFAGRTGPMLAAYRSRLDGTAQPFALYVPKGYTPKKKWRLFVGLHGLNGKPGRYLRYMAGVPLGPDETNESAERDFPDGPALPDVDAFLLAPFGRGDVAFRGPGEDDALSALDTVVERYAVDRDRIHLTGASMGGIGAFELAVHRPDLFASVVPLCGAADVRMYASIGDRPLRDFEASVLAATAAVEWAPNLRHVRMWCVHGKKDATNPASRSRVMIDRLAALGYRDVLYEEPVLGHNVWDYTYAGGALWKKSDARRDPFPAQVTFTSGDLRWRSAYWVRIDEAADRTRFATIDARRDKEHARIEVTATNVAAFSLLLPPAVARADAPVEVLVGGAVAFSGPVSSLGSGPGAVPVLSLRAGPKGAFGRAEEAPALAPPPGPLGVMSLEPRLYVWGSADPVLRLISKTLAERLAEPGGIESSRFPVKPDWAVTAADLAAYDVVAVGTPETNWLLAAATRTGRGLPVKFERDAIVVAGKRWSGRDVGVAFAAPSPFRPGRSIIVYGSIGPAGLGLARHLPRYLPDYVVWDRRIAAATGGAVLGERDVLAAGFF